MGHVECGEIFNFMLPFLRHLPDEEFFSKNCCEVLCTVLFISKTKLHCFLETSNLKNPRTISSENTLEFKFHSGISVESLISYLSYYNKLLEIRLMKFSISVLAHSD